MFGLYVFAGACISLFATLSLVGLWMTRNNQLPNTITVGNLHDSGKMMFGFTVFWAYIAFSQFMLIWYGNIPEETIFFAHRWEHGWKAVSIFLVVGHFGLPFLFLLIRNVKRHSVGLSLASLWLLAIHYLDIYWLIMPNHGGFHPAPTDFLCLLGVGGFWLAALGWLIQRKKLVPVKDPRLAESLAFENA
jgi:uncharacterized membrane protein YpjA